MTARVAWGLILLGIVVAIPLAAYRAIDVQTVTLAPTVNARELAVPVEVVSGPLDVPPRNPFTTGAEFRAATREAPPVRASAAAPPPPPPPPAIRLLGTLVKGGVRFAVLNRATVAEGAEVDGYRIRTIEPERVVIERDGRTLTIEQDGADPAAPRPSASPDR